MFLYEEDNGKFFKVSLNGPKRFFFEDTDSLKISYKQRKMVKITKHEWRGLKWTPYYVEEAQDVIEEEGLNVYCKVIDRKMIDVITGMEYPQTFYNTENFNVITYRIKNEVTTNEVYNFLRSLNKVKIDAYVRTIKELNRYFESQYVSLDDKMRKEKLKQDAEDKKKDYIDEFMKDSSKRMK